MWIRPPNEPWQLQQENRQLAAINYENGFQNMILSVDFSDLKGQEAVWIFPVPATPDKTVIDVVKGFPQFSGYDIKRKTDSTISGAFNTMRLTQLYPLFLFPFYFYSGFGSTASDMKTGSILGEHGGVTLYEHIEKMGLVTELITAETGDALYNYLMGKDLNLPASSKAVFDEYTGYEYSFVVSWINDIPKFKEEQVKTGYSSGNVIAVSLTFPTDKMYYPLKPTSIYGSQSVPATIYVMGYVTPELYPAIKSSSTVNYFAQDYSYSPPVALKSFFNDKTSFSDMRYTIITLNPPSKYLTEDLWISQAAPLDVIAADFINKNVWGRGEYSKTC
ncbi:MAG: hypothetical protein ABIG30_01650 [Candidatus Aenigmatarchaeota archaeon]